MAEEWKYSDLIGDQRKSRMFAAKSFEEIADRIAIESDILCYHLQDCDDDRGYKRHIFCVQVSAELFDDFFNSPKGYRSMYFQSPFRGLQANSYLFERIVPKLSTWATTNHPVYNTQIGDSLLALSAKAWLAEAGLHLCDACRGEWSCPDDEAPEIIKGRWEKNDNAWGSKAPLLKKIRLIGAFLNDRGDEFVPATKRKRHHDIFSKGWS